MNKLLSCIRMFGPRNVTHGCHICWLSVEYHTTLCTDRTTPVSYVLAPTCFGSSLPSSGSLLDPPELLEIQIGRVVYHIMCGYVTCVSDCRGSVCCVSQRYMRI
jgi:hypothetical protein